MMGNEKKIVAIYTRVSTTDQAREGHSLEEQEKRLRASCEAQGYTIYKVYTDAGISGKSAENRPEYQQMLKDMKSHKFNIIMAFKMDRLSRSIADFEVLFNELKKYNCGIDLLCEKIDTNGAAGMMMARIIGIFAQFERELIRERTLIGVESAVSKGHFGGKPPLGYMHQLIDDGIKKSKNWIINEDEAKIVREIFQLCCDGKTYFQISNILRKKYSKVLAFNKIDKKTNEKKEVYRTWSDASISVILNNKSYMGVYEHRKRDKEQKTIEIYNQIPPIISEDIFWECQKNIQKNKRNYYRSKDYLFVQKLVCPKCGRILGCNGTTKGNGTEYRYYKCKDCGVYIREELIEKALIDELNNYLQLKQLISDNYVPIDKNIADDFNKCRLNHKIRFALDERIIQDKYNCDWCFELNEIWNMADYDVKCKFINEFVDDITIKEYKNKNNNINKITILNLKLKDNKVNKLFEMKNNGLLDEIFGKGQTKFSLANFKHESDANEYINLLKKKYNIVSLEQNLGDYEFFWDLSFFKVININPSKAVEKKKSIYLYLTDI